MGDVEVAISVYEQIGGDDAVNVTVQAFYERVLADPILVPFFIDVDMVMLKRQQVAFFSQALGGPEAYRGPNMKMAHAQMSIEEEHFERVAQHLVATLQSLGVPQEHIETIVQALGPLAADIVNTKNEAETDIPLTPKNKKKRKESRMGQNGSQTNGGAAVLDAPADVMELEGKIAAMNRSQAVIEFNLDGTIITANDNFLQALGYTLPEIQGKHHRMFAEPAYAASSEYTAFWAKLNRGEFDAGQYQRIGKGGKEIWIEASYNPIMDASGNPYKVVKFATDITAQKNKDAESNSKIKAISKAQAVIEFNLDGTIITANDNFLQTLGYTLPEIQGKHHRMFAEPAYAASSEYTEFWAKLNRGEFDAGVYKRVGKGGQDVWIQASYNPIYNVNGVVYKVVKFATDITEFKKLNEEYEARNMAVGNGNAVIDFTPDGIILDANENFLKTLGYTLDEIKGKHHRMFCDPGYVATSEYLAFWEKLKQGEFDAGSYMRIGKGGKEVWIQASYNPIVDGNGQTYKVVKFATDITEAHRMEIEAEKNRERERENATKLQEGVEEIAQIGTTLAAASEELTSVASTMGATAEETSSQANVVAAAAEEVSKNVQSVSTGSEEMTASIQAIAKNTTDAAKVAAQAVSVAETTNDTVAKLGQSSAEIGSIIKVINSIAQQTNLLALNATIEAARAGEAGKGFAVVANEVKELAKETTKATENISRMIETIQGDTKGSADAIAQITIIIKQVNDYMNTIASAVEEQTVTTNEMARNVSEASKGSMEIAGNIVSVADAAGSTTEGAMQTQQSSAELSKMAADLQRVVATLT